MSELKLLPDEIWSKVGYWTFKLNTTSTLDRNFINFNHDDRSGYMLVSEDLLERPGLTCLEFHILIRIRASGNEAEEMFMLDIPFMICGPSGPTQAQLDAKMPDVTLCESAPIDYLDQNKVLEALINLETKGLIIINRNEE